MFPLTPILSSDIQSSLTDSEKIQEWTKVFGSPLNIVFPLSVAENVKKFQNVFTQHNLNGVIYYALKANKSQAILKQLALSDTKVDVASERELQQALSCGFIGSRIEATGPKNNAFLRLAILHGVTINVNSLQELRMIEEIANKLNTHNAIAVFIRMKEFVSDVVNIFQKDAKFGLNLNEVESALDIILSSNGRIEFSGFSFHLTTISEQERLIAIEQLLKSTARAIEKGLHPKGINIGGGFGVNYLALESEWNNYIMALKNSVVDPSHTAMSWGRSGLGYWAEHGKLKGSAMYSEFYRSFDQFEELNNTLQATLPSFGNCAEFMLENNLSLFIEPGRALLDGAGITLAKVESVNTSTNGETVVFLGMNRSNLNAIELEFMSDPLIIPASDRELIKAEDGIFLSGNLCLPHDFICRRKVFLPHVLGPVDILAFINTAAYHMDFTESETAQHSIAKKIAVNPDGWELDNLYTPFLI
jgi:diaminopimelate decarboxylase